MRATPHPVLMFFLMLLLLAWLSATSFGAQAGSEGDDFDPAAISWRQLVFKGKQAMGKARTQIQLEARTVAAATAAMMESPHGGVAVPEDSDVYLITADIEAKFLLQRKKWSGRVWFLPDEGAALQRIRHKPGKGASDRRLRYGPEGVYRRRAEPEDKREAKLSADIWTKVRKSFYAYAGDRTGCDRVSDPLVLFYIVSAAGMSEGREVDLCVFNKKELYQVTLKTVGTEQVVLDVTEKRGQSSRQVKRSIDALKIQLKPRLQDPGRQEPEAFEFIGLTGDLLILLDPNTGIPVGVRGELPVAGRTNFKLTEVTLSDGRRKTETPVSGSPRP